MRGRLEQPGPDRRFRTLHPVFEEADEGFLGRVLGGVRITCQAMAVAHQGRVLRIEGCVEIHGRGGVGGRRVADGPAVGTVVPAWRFRGRVREGTSGVWNS